VLKDKICPSILKPNLDLPKGAKNNLRQARLVKRIM